MRFILLQYFIFMKLMYKTYNISTPVYLSHLIKP